MSRTARDTLADSHCYDVWCADGCAGGRRLAVGDWLELPVRPSDSVTLRALERLSVVEEQPYWSFAVEPGPAASGAVLHGRASRLRAVSTPSLYEGDERLPLMAWTAPIGGTLYPTLEAAVLTGFIATVTDARLADNHRV